MTLRYQTARAHNQNSAQIHRVREENYMPNWSVQSAVLEVERQEWYNQKAG